MSHHLKLLLFIIPLLTTSCSQTEITGKWKLETNPSFDQGMRSNQSSWEGLILNSDSTFVIGEDTTEPIVHDTVPGWHTGGKFTGNWRVEGNKLLLHPADIEEPIYLSYEIIQLTFKRLVLLSTFDKGDTTKNITYSRDK